MSGERRRPGDRPPQPHALRRGLRHLPVRRGVAVRRGDPLLPAGAGGGASDADDDGDAGAGRPARGRGGGGAAAASSWSSGGSARRRPTCRRCRPSAGPPARPSGPATGTRWSCSTRPAATRCAPFQRAAAEGRIALAASAATHAVLPLLATRAGLRLQLDAGIRSHRRRFGWDGGFWLPECAYAPGPRVAAGRARGALVLRRPERPRPSRSTRWRRSRPRPGRWRCRSTGRRSAGSGRSTATPPTPPTPSSPANRCAACGSGRSAAAPTTRPPPAARRAPPGGRVPRRRRRAAARPTPPSAAAAACSSSRSTPSCSATGGRRGRSGCEAVLEGAAAAGRPAAHRAAGARRARAGRARRSRASTWGEGKDLRTWDSPPVADLAWGARRLELRLLRAVSAGPARGRAASAPRASCSPPRRATGPSSTSAARRATTPTSAPPTTREAMLEAIDSAAATDPRMRSLAPDLSLAPLLEP